MEQPTGDAASAASTEGSDPCLQLLTLLPDLRKLIICKLTRDASSTLAATSSAALQAVLQARTDLRALTLHRSLAPSLARLRFSAVSGPPSKAVVQCLHMGIQTRVWLPWHAVPDVCAQQQQLANVHIPPYPDFFWLCPAAIAAAHRFEAGELNTPNMWSYCLPPGLAALQEVKLIGLDLQSDSWLPQSSQGGVRELILDESKVRSLPGGLQELEHVSMRYCSELTAGWLPESSKQRVRYLDMSATRISGVPAGMRALQAVRVTSCHDLAGDWLPESSRQNVRLLDAYNTRIGSVPHNMAALEVVRVSHNVSLHADWLPASSRQRVHHVDAGLSNITHMPNDMRCLKTVAVVLCKNLAADWLPETSRGRVHTLLAGNSNLHSVPLGLGALETLWMAYCTLPYKYGEWFDYGDWLPASSRARIKTIIACGSDIGRLPAGMAALSILDVRDCHKLASTDWLPASSTGNLRQLRAEHSRRQGLPERVRELQAPALPPSEAVGWVMAVYVSSTYHSDTTSICKGSVSTAPGVTDLVNK